MAKDCRDCKSYRDCIGKVWYSYIEIRFCPYQVLWIIEFSEIIGTGIWPPNPVGSTYIDPNIKTGYRKEAYYTKPMVVLAEVNARLARAGTHGKLLRAEVLAGMADNLSPESKSALMYVKGWRRKRMSFQRWLRDRRYQGKKLTKSSV